MLAPAAAFLSVVNDYWLAADLHFDLMLAHLFIAQRKLQTKIGFTFEYLYDRLVIVAMGIRASFLERMRNPHQSSDSGKIDWNY